jgi:hypothetical protein
MLAAHPRNILRLDAAEISDVAAAVRFSIGVDQLTINPDSDFLRSVDK